LLFFCAVKTKGLFQYLPFFELSAYQVMELLAVAFMAGLGFLSVDLTFTRMFA